MTNKTAFDGQNPIALESSVAVQVSASASATVGHLTDEEVAKLMSSRSNYIDFQRGSATHHELFSLDTDAHSEGYLTYCHCEREPNATLLKTITVNINNGVWSLVETPVGGDAGKKYAHYIGIHQYDDYDEEDDVYITILSDKATPYTLANIIADFAGVSFSTSGFTSGGLSTGAMGTNSIITYLEVSSTEITLYYISTNDEGQATRFSGQYARTFAEENTTITDIVKEV